MRIRTKRIAKEHVVTDAGKQNSQVSAASETDTRADKEIEEQIIRDQFVRPEDSGRDQFPHLTNISAAFMYRFMPHPDVPTLPEYVYLPLPSRQTTEREASLELQLAVSQWNLAWEADHLRYELFETELPSQLRWLEKYRDKNICLVPDEGRTRYGAYSGLYHLLPRRTLEKHGLPLLRRGHWPVVMHDFWAERVLPTDFHDRLATAFAEYIWPFISPGSSLDSFSPNDSIRLLSHNLNFWVPLIDGVAQKRLKGFPRVDLNNEKYAKDLAKIRRGRPAGVNVDRPLKGGAVWIGEDDAADAAKELVDQADSTARLRCIVDAIRSNRVEEDFSQHWSYAREDFERRLFRKRNKIKVSFVELSDTIPVHGADSEVYANLFYEDFFALLDPKERRVVVCVRNGITKLGDIARELGYANHSPVSKALVRVRRKAMKYLAD